MYLLEQYNSENKLSQDDCCSLVCNHRPCVVIEVVKVDDLWINHRGRNGQQFLEIGEEGRIIQR